MNCVWKWILLDFIRLFNGKYNIAYVKDKIFQQPNYYVFFDPIICYVFFDYFYLSSALYVC